MLLIVGILLFFVELFFIPGTTVVGVLGILLLALGIFFAYKDLGNTTGHIILTITFIAIIISIVIGAKSNVWSKLSNRTHVEGKANEIDANKIQVGDKGVAISAIRPIGKARINEINFEVKSLGEYINTNSEIEVVKVQGNRITVIPASKESA